MNLIQIIFAGLFSVITVSAFALSYVNLVATAIDAGIPPLLSPLWPLALDLFIVMGSLFVLQASLNQEQAIEGWIVILSFTLVSTAFNVSHSPSDLMSQAAHALPPLALCASLELLMIRLRRDLMTPSNFEYQSNLRVDDVTETQFPDFKVSKVHSWFTENPEGTIESARKELRMGYTTVRDIKGYLLQTGKLGG
ncbi:MAG: DUF2637 domain-containing protein [Methanospirillaceae archaeon]|nr:DUF2637 domain-containing protein [Methanospirillaceae archaeon]